MLGVRDWTGLGDGMNESRQLSVSPELQQTVAEVGPKAERWLEGVPLLVEKAAMDWQLNLGPQVHHGGCASIILPAVTQDGEAAILKLSVPHVEAQYEADALRHWNGDGAVSVLQASADGFTMLLERCVPGHDLWAADIDEQIDMMTDLLPRLWSTSPPDTPFTELARTADRWASRMHRKAAAIGVPDEVADRAQRWAVELAADQPRRLLHGDFHPGNVIAARRHPWLAIDPKPWVGDPAFDIAQVLANWIFVDPATNTSATTAIRARARDLAERLSLDLDRILRWAVVKAVGWDFGRDKTLILDEAAKGS